MSAYVEPPTIPAGMTVTKYRAARPQRRSPFQWAAALGLLVESVAAVRAFQFYYHRNPRG